MAIIGVRWGAAWLCLAGLTAQTPTASAPPTVRGRIVDENGKGLEGAALAWHVWQDFVDTAAHLAKPAAVTGPDGTFALPAVVGRSELVVAKAGRQACGVAVHDAAAQGQLGDIVLPPGARLVGRVRDEHGKAIAGVELRVESALSQRESGASAVQLLAGARSNDQGIFTVPCVPRTGLRLVVTAAGYRTETRCVAQESPLDITLVKVGMVTGRVVGADDKPIAGLSVWARTATSAAMPRVVTGADGTFAMTTPTPGPFRLTATDSHSPLRQFGSDLLQGAAADVVLRPCDPARGASTLPVRVIDAASKQPVPRFVVSFFQVDPSNLQAALFHGRNGRKEYEADAAVELPEPRAPGLLVEASGHGYAAVPMPEDLSKPLVVELGPEVVLQGRVIDQETGKPMAGVAVRALPKGNTSGSGGSWRDAGPLSDANGDYVVRGLPPGEYGVQVHAEGRAASAVAPVTLAVGQPAKLDLTVPRPQYVTVELSGVVPPGPVPLLRFHGGVSSSGQDAGFFQHSIAEPLPVPMPRAGSYRLGPLTPGTRPLQVFVPSRTRIGAGSGVVIGDVDAGESVVKLALPDLGTVLVKGRAELPDDVPRERVALLATRRNNGNDRVSWWGRSVVLTGLDGGGRFEFDVPRGNYTLQLADLETGIVFHTEPEDTVVGDQELVLRPEVHWLALELAPAAAGAPVLVHSFEVTLDAPRDGAAAMLDSWGGGNQQQRGSVSARSDERQPRWLVPRGSLSIEVQQTLGTLRAGDVSWSVDSGASASVMIERREQRVTLSIPAPPTAEELRGK